LSKLKFNPLIRVTACQLAALSFFLLAEADFSFLAATELGAARAEAPVLARALAWLLASGEAERVCFEVAALVAGALAAEPVAAADAGELVPACSVPVEALAAGAPVVELAVGAVAAVGRACSVSVALAVVALVAEPAADAAAEEPTLAYFEAAEAPAAVGVAPAAELVVGAAEVVAAALACSGPAEALAAVALAAELVVGARVADSQAVDYDSAAAELVLAQEWALAANLGVRREVDYDSAEHFAELAPPAARRWVGGRRLAVAELG
jgi:hypothetical protein